MTKEELFDGIPVKNKVYDDTTHGSYKIDLYLPDYKLGINFNDLRKESEVSGGVSHGKHFDQTNEAEEHGIQLFQVFSSDELDCWKSMIHGKLGLNKKIYARKCKIGPITSKLAREFCNLYHMQGFCNSSINLGLFYDNELVEVMTFVKSRFNKNFDYELARLCTKRYVTVVGGASKLFKFFLTYYLKPGQRVMSFANRRFSQGKIYKTLGFNLIRICQQNYFYFNDYDHPELWARNIFQKHKLKNMKHYSPEKTEVQIMHEEGYDHIYDSGNYVFGYE